MKPNGDPCPARIVEHDIHAFVDGVLDDDRRTDLLAYLAAHPLEAEKVNALFRQRANLESLREALASPDDATFALDLQRKLGAALLRQRLFRAGTRTAAGLAVALPVAAAAWWLTATTPPQDVAADEPPVEIHSGAVFPFGSSLAYMDEGAFDDGAETLAELAGHLQSGALGVPDLAGLGLRLVGGEAVSDVALPAARLVYTDEQSHQLLVYVGIYAEGTPQAFTLVPEGHISLHWRKGPLVFAVVGPVDMPLLLEVMRSVSSGVTAVAEAPLAPTAPAVIAPAQTVGDVQPAVAVPESRAPAAPAPLLPGDPAGTKPADPAPLGKEEAKVL